MDRDAPVRFEDLVPPPTEAAIRRVAFVGIGLVAAAAALGVVLTAGNLDLTKGWWVLDTLRLWLSGLGVVTAGYAISCRPGRPQVWLLGGVAALLAAGLPRFLGFLPTIGFVGVPAAWDSAQFMLRVLALVAAVGAGFAALAFAWRLRVASALIVFHFAGIFLATTTPSTQGSPPYWVTSQVFNKVYMPYLQFVYLRNAYHFYSPEPGPASLLCFLVKTDVGEEEVNGVKQRKYERKWVVTPRRPDDVKDPLGVSYFRRLSITEQVAAPGNPGFGNELGEVRQRRLMATYDDGGFPKPIPTDPLTPAEVQYRLPSPMTFRYILPSYAQHVIHEACPTTDAMAKTTVMVYRLEHRTMQPENIRRGLDPYTPPMFRAYYLGEYNVEGQLVDPRDNMLYWQVPVYPKAGSGAHDQSAAACEDYLSRHAGLAFDWSSLR